MQSGRFGGEDERYNSSEYDIDCSIDVWRADQDCNLVKDASDNIRALPLFLS